MKKLALASVLMSASILLSRIIGFIRDAIIAAQFGSGAQTDAYYSSFSLPDFLNYLVAGGAFSLTFIPIFIHYLVNKEEDKGWKLYSIIISTMSVILIIVIIILEFMAPIIVHRMFPGFEGKILEDTILFTRIVLPAQLFFYNGGIIAAILMAKKRFLMPALAPLIYNVSIIIFGLIFAKFGMIGFSIGALVGSFLGPFLFQFLALRKEINFKLNFNIRDKDFLNFLKISVPIMLGLILISLDDWISKSYGSKLPDGTITYLNNSRRLIMVPIGVFAQANAQAILPFLSEFFSKKEYSKFNDLIIKTTTLIFFITSFAASWYIVFHTEIIHLVYQRGAFELKDTIENSKIFLMFAFAVPFWAGVTIVSRFYYAMKNTWGPMIIGAIMLALSIPLFIILPKYMGASGLSLTISITKFLYFIAIFFGFKAVFKEFKLKALFKDLLKIIIFFIIITAIFFFVKREFTKLNWFILLAIGSSIQFIVTLVLAKFLKIDAYQEFLNKYVLRIVNKIKRILGIKIKDNLSVNIDLNKKYSFSEVYKLLPKLLTKDDLNFLFIEHLILSNESSELNDDAVEKITTIINNSTLDNDNKNKLLTILYTAMLAKNIFTFKNINITSKNNYILSYQFVSLEEIKGVSFATILLIYNDFLLFEELIEKLEKHEILEIISQKNNEGKTIKYYWSRNKNKNKFTTLMKIFDKKNKIIKFTRE